jgi:ADP-heptose:LPS heptosyltransferase
VVGNDSGLSHMAAAVGTPTVMLFGPTSHLSLGQLPPHVKVLRTGLECEPCWFRARFQACAAQIHCLYRLTAETVEQELRILLGLDSPG